MSAVNTVNKVSDITAASLAQYLRIPELTADETSYLNTILKVAVDYILKYTGITDAEELDEYTDMIIVVYVLCEDMYDNRALMVNNKNVNRVVETVLGMHQRNLL